MADPLVGITRREVLEDDTRWFDSAGLPVEGVLNRPANPVLVTEDGQPAENIDLRLNGQPDGPTVPADSRTHTPPTASTQPADLPVEGVLNRPRAAANPVLVTEDGQPAENPDPRPDGQPDGPTVPADSRTHTPPTASRQPADLQFNTNEYGGTNGPTAEAPHGLDGPPGAPSGSGQPDLDIETPPSDDDLDKEARPLSTPPAPKGESSLAPDLPLGPFHTRQELINEVKRWALVTVNGAFGIRVRTSQAIPTKNGVLSCDKEGCYLHSGMLDTATKKAECKWRITFAYRLKEKDWVIVSYPLRYANHDVETGHNHPLAKPGTTAMLLEKNLRMIPAVLKERAVFYYNERIKGGVAQIIRLLRGEAAQKKLPITWIEEDIYELLRVPLKERQISAQKLVEWCENEESKGEGFAFRTRCNKDNSLKYIMWVDPRARKLWARTLDNIQDKRPDLGV